jgi:tetratricopeptide (TPR) repeat protein
LRLRPPPGSSRGGGVIKTRVFGAGALAAVMFAAGALLPSGNDDADPRRRISSAGELISAELVAGGDVETTITALQQRVRADGGDPLELAALGSAYLQKARSTADPSYYALARKSLNRSLDLDARNLPAVLGMGELALASHDFSSALTWSDKALAVDDVNPTALGVKGDALAELGRYRDAFHTYQRMVDARPNLSSYARASYARELTGDLRGAVDAMRRAAAAGALVPENEAWTHNQLGELLWGTGKLSRAERAFRAARAIAPDYLAPIAGLGRIDAARGRIGRAIDRFERFTIRFPLPQYVMELGDLHAAAGHDSQARRAYDLVLAQQRLYVANGVLPDVETTLFLADHAHPKEALRMARAQYRDRAAIRVADALAWALYRNGRLKASARHIDEALRLGTKEALIHFHAGMIARARGARGSAHAHLATALRLNPHFSVLHADRAARALKTLGGIQ